MAKDKKAKPDSKPQPAAPLVVQPAAPVVAHVDGAAAEAGAEVSVTDAPQEQKRDAEAPEAIAGASETSSAAQGNQPPPDASGGLVTLAFPLPADIPPFVLERAVVIVTAKPARGRWRAGRQFTREETLIPFTELRDVEIDMLTGDAELVVSLRVQKPD